MRELDIEKRARMTQALGQKLYDPTMASCSG